MKRLETFGLVSCAIGIIYVGIFTALPFSFYVDVEEVQWPDICVGDTLHSGVHASRSSIWNIPGSAYGEAVFFRDDLRVETVIRRGSLSDPISFTYEANLSEATYDVLWNRPFVEPGTYGVQDVITIYPLPLITKTHVFLAEDNRFNVVECTHD